jgi:hypothetical protein
LYKPKYDQGATLVAPKPNNASAGLPEPFATRFKWPHRLQWKSEALYLDGKGRAIVEIVPDKRYPGMWRVLSSGHLSDMANLARAKDAGVAIACQKLSDRNEIAAV